MHDNFVLVKSRVRCLVNDVVNSGSIVSPSVYETQAIEGTSIGVVVDSITCIAFWQKFVEVIFLVSVLENKSK